MSENLDRNANMEKEDEETIDPMTIHEKMFKLGQPVRIDETREMYEERIQELWEQRKIQIERERTTEPVEEEPSEAVQQFLNHPKIEEYARRHLAGETIDELLQGQGHAEEKRQAIELLSGYLVSPETVTQNSSDTPEELPTSNTSIDQTSNTSVESGETPSTVTVEEKDEHLTDWAASYRLAEIAQNENVDLAALTRIEYAQYAIDHGLAIEDRQLRAAPWERTKTSPEEIVKARKALAESIPESVRNDFHTFSHSVMEQAGQSDRNIAEGIRVHQGTKDSDTWLFFGINGGTGERPGVTHKAYLTFKDLRSSSPDRIVAFMEALRDSGYNGDLKTFQDLEFHGVHLHDQVVMHGASEQDAQLAARVAEQFFANELADVEMGQDEVVDGKELSYSQLLANKVASGAAQAHAQRKKR
jgi:hypothetical protein